MSPGEELGVEVIRSFCAMTLFVNGASEHSAAAIMNTRRVGELFDSRVFRLTIIDIHHDARDSTRVLVTPTLVKTHPAPERRVVGDLSDIRRVIRALAIELPHPGRFGADSG